MAETGLQQNGGQDLHGRIGRDACDQLSFPKVILHIFSMFIPIAVSNASSSSLHLKHGALGYATDMRVWGLRGSFSR